MQIAVCLKAVPDVHIRLDLEAGTSRIDPHDLIYEMNSNDRLSLWEALQLRRKMDAAVTVISAGGEPARCVLRQGLARGADRAILIAGTPQEQAGGLKAIGHLMAVLQEVNPDLVFCGDESADAMQGAVGPFLAHRLGFSLIPEVVEIVDVDPNRKAVRLQRYLGRGMAQLLEDSMPAVIVFMPWQTSPHGPESLEFMPDLSSRLRSLDQSIEIFHPVPHEPEEASEDAPGSGPEESHLALARKRREILLSPPPRLPAEQRIELLYASAGGLRSGGETLEGAPEKIAEKLLHLLEGRGFSF